MSIAPCPVCGCNRVEAALVHAMAAALAADDLDRAIEAGLLTCEGCDSCAEDCTRKLLTARDARLRALAARARYREREARLQRRAAERTAARAVPESIKATDAAALKPALPSAAAAALARAKAKAAGRDSS